MGEVQEQRYACKVCGKPCVSGRSLGGHMRAHLSTIAASKKPRKTEIKTGGDGREGVNHQLIESTKDQSFSNADDDQNTSYGLRENPKKSWRISIPDPERCLYTWKTGHPCQECGKEFPSSRALSGHMRTHSKKNKNKNENETHQCKKCGKGFDSIRAMFGHMRIHSRKRSRVAVDDGDNPFADIFSGFKNIGPVRKKRSTIRYKAATPNPCSSEYNKCEAVFEVEDMEEVAGILIMLSKGVSNEPPADFDFVCGVDKENGVCEFDGLGSCFAAKDEDKSGCACANELDKDFLVPNAANEEPASENKANLGRIKLGFDRKGKGKELRCLVCFKEVKMTMLGQDVMNHEVGVEVEVDVDVADTMDINFPVTVDEGAKRDAGPSLWCTEMGREVFIS